MQIIRITSNTVKKSGIPIALLLTGAFIIGFGLSVFPVKSKPPEAIIPCAYCAMEDSTETTNAFSKIQRLNYEEATSALPTPTRPSTPKSMASTTPTVIPTLPPTYASNTPQLISDTPVTKRVMVIDFNPVLEKYGNLRLREYKGWNDTRTLESQFIQDIRDASKGYFTYHISLRIENVDAYPMKNTGYVFTDDSYLAALSTQDANARAIIDYNTVLAEYDVCDKVNRGEIDELWLWGGPWFGYWEAVMAGTGAYNTNASPILNTSCKRKLHIFGFSYERGISEMLEDFGHRTEGTMRQTFNGWFQGMNTDWDRFTKSRVFHASEGSFDYGCGTVHEPFNANDSYDWSNTSVISTTCKGWSQYPPEPASTQRLSCSEWGCTGYGYMKMWLSRLPKATGQKNGIWNNWWKYIGDIN